MPSPKPRLVVSNRIAEQPCSCRTWGLLGRLSRDLILHDFTERARLLHQVQLKMLTRGEHVAICELVSTRSGHGQARRVMTELCAWSDCARVTLELSPSSQWGSDVERLTRFYTSLGFSPNHEPEERFLIQEAMIRYPVRGRGHVRLCGRPGNIQSLKYPLLAERNQLMIITELLVTAYNGDKPVFVLNLAPEIVTTVLTTNNEAGETEAGQTSIVSASERAEWVLEAVRDVVEELTSAQSR